MGNHAEKTSGHMRRPAANKVSAIQPKRMDAAPVPNGPERIASGIYHEAAANSPGVRQLSAYQRMADHSAAGPAKDQAPLNEGLPKMVQRKANDTGLPDQLKAGIESLSGYLMDDVNVHYNSDKPAQLQAHAYAQGTDIHIAPGQEKHLPHEAWHVVQQKQGRVLSTMQMKGEVPVNDDPGLEKEADEMGQRALATTSQLRAMSRGILPNGAVVQRISIRFANLGNNDKYKSKASDIIEALLNTPGIARFLARKTVLITLEATSQLANISVSNDHNQVQITLSPWFFEQESRGRILGMLAHEFGVHPLADAELTQPERTAENNAVANNNPIATGIANHHITPGEAGQRDHVFAAVDQQPRFLVYRRTVHQMATTMLQQSRDGESGVKEKHITDLLLTYLSDIAMILATNDHRARIVVNPQRTADCFNIVRTGWLDRLGDSDDDVELRDLTPGPKTGMDVLNEARGVVGSLLLSVATSSTTDAKTRQAETGDNGLAPTTPIQSEVLKDYGLTLDREPDGLSLFNALDVIMGGSNSKQTALERLLSLANTLPEGPRFASIVAEINGTAFNGAVSWSSLDVVAQTLERKIRVIAPNGKLTASGNHGEEITVLLIPQPTAHYRAATKD